MKKNTSAAISAKTNVSKMKAGRGKSPNKEPFQELRKRHGDMHAMQILNVLEDMALVEDRKKLLLATPDERYAGAMAKLMSAGM